MFNFARAAATKGGLLCFCFVVLLCTQAARPRPPRGGAFAARALASHGSGAHAPHCCATPSPREMLAFGRVRWAVVFLFRGFVVCPGQGRGALLPSVAGGGRYGMAWAQGAGRRGGKQKRVSLSLFLSLRVFCSVLCFVVFALFALLLYRPAAISRALSPSHPSPPPALRARLRLRARAPRTAGFAVVRRFFSPFLLPSPCFKNV